MIAAMEQTTDNTNTATTPAKTTFYDILHSPILDSLSYYLDIADIIALSRTSRPLSGFYACMKPRKWNVDRSLRRFVDEPARLREQIGLTEALIAGDFPLEFFEHGSLHAKTLDLVAIAASAAALIEYLVAAEGYEDEASVGKDATAWVKLTNAPPQYRHTEAVVTLRRVGRHPSPATAGAPPARISVFTTSHFSFPLRGILEGSTTTASVCFMSHRRAYSVFPALTHGSRTAFFLTQPRPDHGVCVADLRGRGYRVETHLSAHEVAGGQSGHGLQGWRKVGDRFCWMVDFPELEGKEGGGEGVAQAKRMDPVKEEDVIRISECTTYMTAESMALMVVHGFWSYGEGGVERLYHYDAKLMRWNKIFC